MHILWGSGIFKERRLIKEATLPWGGQLRATRRTWCRGADPRWRAHRAGYPWRSKRRAVLRRRARRWRPRTAAGSHGAPRGSSHTATRTRTPVHANHTRESAHRRMHKSPHKPCSKACTQECRKTFSTACTKSSRSVHKRKQNARKKLLNGMDFQGQLILRCLKEPWIEPDIIKSCSFPFIIGSYTCRAKKRRE